MKEKKYSISPKNQKDLTEFLNSIKAEGTDNPSTLTNYETSIRKIQHLLNKDISKITTTDLDKVFSNIKSTGTRELNKIYFKKFLRFKKREKLADHIKINAKYFKESSKTANDVLSEDEIKLVLNSQNSNRDLAIFELFLTTGIRREELATLKIKNIHKLKDEIKVEITKSKSPERKPISIIPYPNNPIAFYPKNFVAYYDNHPNKDDTEKPLFYSGDYRRPGMEFEVHGINQIIYKVGKKAGLTKKLTPHILRHTSATYDGHHLTEQQLMIKYGWKSSEMAKKYCHLNEEQLSNHLKQKAGLTPQILEKESKCPFCGQTNNINDVTCINCKRTISKDEMAKQQKKQEERENNLQKIIQESNTRLLEYENQINELKTIKTDENTVKVISDLLLVLSESYLRDIKNGLHDDWKPSESKLLEAVNFLREKKQQVKPST